MEKSWDTTVSIVTGYRLDDQQIRVWVPVGLEFSLFYVIQAGSGAHPASYPIGTGGSFPRGKAAGEWS
jgi:hypothetical protein